MPSGHRARKGHGEGLHPQRLHLRLHHLQEVVVLHQGHGGKHSAREDTPLTLPSSSLHGLAERCPPTCLAMGPYAQQGLSPQALTMTQDDISPGTHCDSVQYDITPGTQE